MKTLVTGGAGYIGSCLARELVDQGHEVVALDNLITGSRRRVPDRAAFVEADLRDLEAVRAACEGAEVVFHLGALRSVTRSVEHPVLSTECNVIGTLNVLLAAQEAGVRRVVYASSSSVYGDAPGSVQREDATPRPISPYAAGKLAGEHYCRVWSQLHGLSTVSLRYFNVFGPGQPRESRYALVFPAFVSALVAGEAPELHWDGEQSRDFTFIDDVLAANLAAAEAGPAADGEAFNIGGGRPKTINEVLRTVSEVLGVWVEPKRLPQRPGDVRSTHADIGKAAEVLGWAPKTDWPDAVTRTVEWFRSQVPEGDSQAR